MNDDELRDRLQRLLVGYYIQSTYPSTPRYVGPKVRFAVGATDAVRTVRVPHPDYPRRRDLHALQRVHTTDPDRVRAAWDAVGQDAVDAIVITSAEPAEPIGQRPVWEVDGFRDGIEGRAVRFFVRTREGTTIATKTRKGLPAALKRYEAACDEDWTRAQVLHNAGTHAVHSWVPIQFEVTNARASPDGISLVGRLLPHLGRTECRLERASDGTWIDAMWRDGTWGSGAATSYDRWMEHVREQDAAAVPDEDEEALALLG